MSQEKKDIEIVSGDGKDLKISPVYDHLKSAKPKPKKDNNKNIVVPTTNKKQKRK